MRDAIERKYDVEPRCTRLALLIVMLPETALSMTYCGEQARTMSELQSEYQWSELTEHGGVLHWMCMCCRKFKKHDLGASSTLRTWPGVEVKNDRTELRRQLRSHSRTTGHVEAASKYYRGGKTSLLQ